MPVFGQAVRHYWTLDPSAAHLNHGSFGATPKPVLAAQDAIRQEMEGAIGDFFVSQLATRLRQGAEHIAPYLGAAAEDLVFLDNATTGMQAVIGSLDLTAGDEILITDQTYGAVRNIARHYTARVGARLIEVALPFPIADDGRAILAAYTKGLGPRTRLVVLDHVTSGTALVMPLEGMIAKARSIGAMVLVDGAHAPGQIDLDLRKLDADFYTGNFHKWFMAPKGAAFLWTRRELQKVLHPPVISHGYGAGYVAEFDWTGTRDPSAYLSVAAALAFRERFGDGSVKARNRALAAEAGQRLAKAWKTRIGGPAISGASMCMIELPIRSGNPLELRLKLWRDHRIDVPINALAGGLWVRISAQIYNEMADYDRLAKAVLAW